MAAPVASQALRQAAAFLAFEVDGSVYCGPGADLRGSWDGFGRFDAATGKVAIVRAPMTGPVALVGDGVPGVREQVLQLLPGLVTLNDQAPVRRPTTARPGSTGTQPRRCESPRGGPG